MNETPLKDAIETANAQYLEEVKNLYTSVDIDIPDNIEVIYPTSGTSSTNYTITTYPTVLDKLDSLPKPFSYRATRKKLIIMFDELEFASHKKKNELADKIYRFIDTLTGDESYYDICVLWGKFE